MLFVVAEHLAVSTGTSVIARQLHFHGKGWEEIKERGDTES